MICTLRVNIDCIYCPQSGPCDVCYDTGILQSGAEIDILLDMMAKGSFADKRNDLAWLESNVGHKFLGHESYVPFMQIVQRTRQAISMEPTIHVP